MLHDALRRSERRRSSLRSADSAGDELELGRCGFGLDEYRRGAGTGGGPLSRPRYPKDGATHPELGARLGFAADRDAHRSCVPSSCPLANVLRSSRPPMGGQGGGRRGAPGGARRVSGRGHDSRTRLDKPVTAASTGLHLAGHGGSPATERFTTSIPRALVVEDEVEA